MSTWPRREIEAAELRAADRSQAVAAELRAAELDAERTIEDAARALANGERARAAGFLAIALVQIETADLLETAAGQ